MKKNAIIILFLFFSSLAVFAQTPEARIISFDGDSFSLIRNGEETVFDLNYEIFRNEAESLKIREGDTLSTEDSTFLEISFSPSGNVIKVSENTYLTFSEMNSDGSGIVDLIYGSVRSKINNAGSSLYTIRNQTVAAGVGDSDFGFDFTFSADTQTGAKANVYSFSGNVNVVEVSEEGMDPDYSRAVRIKENEQLTIDTANPSKDIKTSKVRKIDDQISEYWNENDFQETQADTDTLAAAESGADEETETGGGTSADAHEAAVTESEADNAADVAAAEPSTDVSAGTDQGTEASDETAADDETAVAEEEEPVEIINEEELDPAERKRIAGNVITTLGFGLEAAGAIVYALSPFISESGQDTVREITLWSMGGVAVATITALIINAFSGGGE